MKKVRIFMFCRYCGNEIDEKSAFCPSCGNKNNAIRNKFAIKKKWLIIVIIILLSIVGCIGLLIFSNQDRHSDRDSSNKKNSKVTENFEIDNSRKDDLNNKGVIFDVDNLTCDGYVKLEDDHIHSISPRSYIPDTGSYIYNNDITGTGKYSKTSLKVSVDVFQGIMFEETTNADIVCHGQFYMTGTTNEDVLIKHYSQNILGTESQQIEMIPLNSSYTLDDGSIITSPPNNFIVSVEAGTFENCICMIVDNSTKEYGESYIVSYYAPLIGKVLELHYDELLYKESGIEWFVYYELVEIKQNVYNSSNDSYSIWQNGKRCVYWDGEGCEHIININSVNNDSSVTITIDYENEITLSLYALAENRIYAYSSSDEKYYLEYDIENLSNLYFRYEEYEGECYFLPDIGADEEYGY